MKENQIKSAFLKVKQDIQFLESNLSNLNSELKDLKYGLEEVKSLIKHLHEDLNNQKLHEISNQTLRHINSTDPVTSTHNQTLRQEIEGLKSPNLSISIGNEGVSTDRQTDTSTDTLTHKNTENSLFLPDFKTPKKDPSLELNIQEASEILESLDNLKKQIRRKFKKITTQEMAVFSTIYHLEEQEHSKTTYKQIAQTLNLSESSIRDYVQRMIIKGIPIKKQKINNRTLLLSISPELKKVATLSTIIQLRDL